MSTENNKTPQQVPLDGGTTQAAQQPSAPYHNNNIFSFVVKYLSKVVDPFSSFGSILAGAALTVMMFMIFVDVFGRYLFHRPIDGVNELTEFMMAVLVGFALAYCALKKGHIRVDLLMQYLPQKVNRWFDMFTYAFSCAFYAFVTWQAWEYAFEQKASGLTSPVLYIPVYPFIFVMTIGTALITLVLFRDFLKSIEEVIG